MRRSGDFWNNSTNGYFQVAGSWIFAEYRAMVFRDQQTLPVAGAWFVESRLGGRTEVAIHPVASQRCRKFPCK
jgi:hypothetical protein